VYVLATIQVELAGLFAAEAEGQKSVVAQKANRADDSVGNQAFRVAVVELDDHIVWLTHGTADHLAHRVVSGKQSWDHYDKYRQGR
jgi:hypothetical protein